MSFHVTDICYRQVPTLDKSHVSVYLTVSSWVVKLDRFNEQKCAEPTNHQKDAGRPGSGP